MDTQLSRTELLWHEVHERLRAFIRRRVKSEHDADDLLQDVFVRIHERARSLRDEGSIIGWVFTVARNAITDYYRHSAVRSRETNCTGTGIDVSEPEMDDEETSRELSRCMAPFTDQLPEHYREAVRLVEFEGLTHAQAAERLGMSVSGVKSRVQRGRAMLRDMLLDCCTVELDRRKGVVEYERRKPGGDDGSSGSCGCSG